MFHVVHVGDIFTRECLCVLLVLEGEGDQGFDHGLSKEQQSEFKISRYYGIHIWLHD